MGTPFSQNKHLISRAGFGISILQIEDIKNKKSKTMVADLFKEYPFTEITYNTPDFIPIEYTDPKATADQKREAQKITQKQNVELNLNFLIQMTKSEDQLREKMAFFLAWSFCNTCE